MSNPSLEQTLRDMYFTAIEEADKALELDAIQSRNTPGYITTPAGKEYNKHIAMQEAIETLAQRLEIELEHTD